jgi:hypothetical protein
MKVLFAMATLLVSILTFSQETSFSWVDDLHSFNVNLPQGHKFQYLDPKTYTVYNNMTYGEGNEDTTTLIKLLGLKTKEEIKKYYIVEKKNNDQVITGSYWFVFKKEYVDKATKIVKECSSTQELVGKMKPIDSQPMISIDNFNGDKGGVYYTISDFYYTIDLLSNGEYCLYVIFPIGKERTLKN